MDFHLLSRPDFGQLCLLEVSGYPNVLKGNQDQQALARLNDLADFDRLLGHHAIHRRNNGGVAQFQLGRFQVGVRLSDPSNRSSSIGLPDGNLFVVGPRLLDPGACLVHFSLGCQHR